MENYSENKGSGKRVAVIGLGISGIAASYFLLDNNVEFTVFQSSKYSSATWVAAGFINPVAGRKIELSDEFEKYFKETLTFYNSLEALLGLKFFHTSEQKRLIKGKEEFDFIKRNQINNENPYIKGMAVNEEGNEFYGYLSIYPSYYLDTQVLVKGFIAYLNSKNKIIDLEINFSDFLNSKNEIIIKGQTYTDIIFCTGSHDVLNPYFDNSKFSLVKGEVLHIQTKEIDRNPFVFHGNYLIPHYEENTFRVGATYDWKDLSSTPTKLGQSKLMDIIESFGIKSMETLDHLAGVRPATTDRKPFIEESKLNPNIFRCNGLGTKGLNLAAFCGKSVVEMVLNK